MGWRSKLIIVSGAAGILCSLNHPIWIQRWDGLNKLIPRWWEDTAGIPGVGSLNGVYWILSFFLEFFLSCPRAYKYTDFQFSAFWILSFFLEFFLSCPRAYKYTHFQFSAFINVSTIRDTPYSIQYYDVASKMRKGSPPRRRSHSLRHRPSSSIEREDYDRRTSSQTSRASSCSQRLFLIKRSYFRGSIRKYFIKRFSWIHYLAWWSWDQRETRRILSHRRSGRLKSLLQHECELLLQ
jgi:hypothetical protein